MEMRDFVVKMSAKLLKRRADALSVSTRPIRASWADMPPKRPSPGYRPSPPPRPASNL
jgi:hypothetical protein